MANICAKLKQREKNKYRKILSIDEPVYSIADITVSTSTPYVPGATLEAVSYTHLARDDRGENQTKIVWQSSRIFYVSR